MSVSFSPGRSEQITLSDLLRDLFYKISELITTQVELTKTEIKVESQKLIVAAIFGVAALITGFVFVAFLGISIMLAFIPLVGTILASVIATAILLGLTGLSVGLMVAELQKNSARMNISL